MSSSSIILLFLVGFLVMSIDAYRRCPSRSQSTDEVSRLRERCKYGVYEDNCSQYHCAKGPGESCGHPNSMFRSLGQCGDGLRCGCGRCMGCSSVVFPLECYDKTCIMPREEE